MQDVSSYYVELQGELDQETFNATSPLRVQVVRSSPAETLILARTDQSGLIGLIRHLHHKGMLLLSVERKGSPSFRGDENA